MTTKKMITGLLLLFVAASVAALIIKERSRARAIRASGGPAAASAATPAPGPEADKTGAAPATAADSAKRAAPAPGIGSARGAQPVSPDPSKDRKILVTYFITNTRCFSCYKIETLTESAVVNTFAGPLKEGRLEWRVVNTDEPKNAHYLKDYKLYTKSVIVSEVEGGREVRWKNCEKVWDLLDDPKAFETYIVREVNAYLGAS